MRTTRIIKILTVLLSVAFSTGTVRAVDITCDSYWQHDPGTPGDWFNPGNWTNGISSSVAACILNGGKANISSGAAAALSLNCANGDIEFADADPTSTFTVSKFLNIGLNGIGSLHQHNGAVNIGSPPTYDLKLGWYEGDQGTYRIDAGSLVVWDDILVGREGRGYFYQYGGTVTASDVFVGSDSRAIGTYEITQGQFTTGHLRVGGSAASGYFIQSGGTVTLGRIGLGSPFYLGSLADDGSGNPAAVYELQNGTLTFGELWPSRIRIGYAGPGLFLQTGGILERAQLEIGSYDQSCYEVSKGQFLDGTVYLKELGSMKVIGNDVTITLTYYRQDEGGTLVSQFGADGISTIEVTGEADVLGGTWTVLDDGAPLGRFEVLMATGGISGIFDNVQLPSGEWSWGIDSGTILWVEHVPEPTTLSILALLALSLPKRGRLAVLRQRK